MIPQRHEFLVGYEMVLGGLPFHLALHVIGIVQLALGFQNNVLDVLARDEFAENFAQVLSRDISRVITVDSVECFRQCLF